MVENALPVIIYVMNGEEIAETIYGNEKRDILKVDGIIHNVKWDSKTNKKIITHGYKITKVEIVKNDIGIDELKVNCVMI